MTRIRLATPEDAEAIGAVHAVSWDAVFGGRVSERERARNDRARRIAFWREALGEPARLVFVALDRERVVGFISGGPMPASIRGRSPIPQHDAYVHALYVDPAHQRARVGTALLAALAVSLREHGARSLALHVVDFNPARAFYERLGARYLYAEPFAPFDEGTQLAYGWSDLDGLSRGPRRVLPRRRLGSRG